VIFKDIDIKELFCLMEEHDIAETTLQDGKAMVMVKRQKEPVAVTASNQLYKEFSVQSVSDTAVNAQEIVKPDEIEEMKTEPHCSRDEKSENGYHNILSPLVGTFYQAPAPDVPPFVEVGDHVNANDVVCIVEAMKSMNEIQSDVKGVIKEVCVENAQMVEFGQVLFKIEPSG
jgi:acetyl-CoA carboxylase biotin carboxyl carrier protein